MCASVLMLILVEILLSYMTYAAPRDFLVFFAATKKDCANYVSLCSLFSVLYFQY